MLATIDKKIEIEDLRDHSPEILAGLRNALAGGGRMVPDAKRRDLYEVESDSLTYYIHVSPVTGNILLLATWPNGSLPMDTARPA